MIHRAEHKNNFSRLDNALIRNNNLSDGAFRLMVFVLSCSDDFAFSVSGLASLLNMSEKKVMRLTNELKAAGYIKQEKKKDGLGRFGSYTWEIYEAPELPENGSSENGNLGTELPENRTSEKPNFRKRAPIRTINNKELSNSKNYQMIDKENYKRKPHGTFKNVLLSDPEFENLERIMGEANRSRYIDLISYYLKDNPDVKYPNHYKTVIRWYERDKPATLTPISPGVDWIEIEDKQGGAQK